ncbi:MAG: hypothetical protein ACJ71F_08395 [Nitrososphaeraceae archaeon]
MDQSSILNEEIKSWEHFEYALREENRLLFNKMLSECRENEDYIRAKSKDEFVSAESLFMVLILHQQKMINELIEASKRKMLHR